MRPRRPWTIVMLATDRWGRVQRTTRTMTTSELSAHLELKRAALSEAIALLHSRHPVQRAEELLADIGIPATYTPQGE